jgi:tetratricopeptide (TPR) repeat protein
VLYEALISTGSLRPLVRDDPALLPHLDIEYANSPAALPYYGDQEWDALLDDCAHRLPSTTFLFPVAALRCIRVLADISGGCMFLLAADKGYHSDQALLDGAGSPFPVLHSDLCFSFMVDFQAISLFVRRRGGTVLQSANQRNLGISGLLLAGNGVEHHETVQAFESAVGKFGPDDLFSLTRHFEKRIEETSFEEIMATLRLSVWDARLLWAAMPVFHRCLEALDDSARSELRDAVHRVWELYYPIGEQADLPFYIGVLLLEVKFYADALRFFHESERLYGPASSTAYNIGACYVHLQQFDSALKAVDRSLELEPAFDAAKTTRIRIESLLAGRHS